jgi:outer membrane protein OmpA-like peptidoglycan-associated protein
MKGSLVITLIALLALWTGFVSADELAFPTTEQEIIKALSLKDGKTVYQGVEYVSDEGKVYKIIDGKRYRLRGLQSIVDSKIVPRAGALINFDFDSAKIRPDSYPLLDEFGKALKFGLADGVFIVAGHTDNTGSMDYNQGLSESRANAVANYLSAHHGIVSSRLIMQGYGEKKPIASNDSDNGRALNRRVEFIRVE